MSKSDSYVTESRIQPEHDSKLILVIPRCIGSPEVPYRHAALNYLDVYETTGRPDLKRLKEYVDTAENEFLRAIGEDAQRHAIWSTTDVGLKRHTPIMGVRVERLVVPEAAGGPREASLKSSETSNESDYDKRPQSSGSCVTANLSDIGGVNTISGVTKAVANDYTYVLDSPYIAVAMRQGKVISVT